MKHRFIVSLVLSLFCTASAASFAQTTPATPAATDTPAPPPNASEAAFVSGIQADLNKRFPSPAAAEKAGYRRYTNEDDTGAISYTNLRWTSTDQQHPSQLWYDVNGRLLGADFSVPQAGWAQAPSLWGVDPSRWVKFRQHIHYALNGPNGAVTYGGMSAAKYAAAGGDPQHPDGAGLVKAGIAKSIDDVRFVFYFPAIWDLIVWVLPNPSGAFAEKNPNVTPSANAKMQM
jgi:hypothetical protein